MSNEQDTARVQMIARVKQVLNLPDEQEPDVEAAIGDDVDAAFRWVSKQTGQDYSAPTDVPVVRTFDAPPSSTLGLPTLNMLPVPKVKLSTAELSVDTQYRFGTYPSGTQYIQRLLDGQPVLWTDGVTDVAGAITIEADWSLPDEVGDVWLQKAVRLSNARGFGYNVGGGNAALGVSSTPADDSDLAARLLPFWRPPVRQVMLLGVDT